MSTSTSTSPKVIDLLITQGMCVTPEGVQLADIAIDQQKIVAMGSKLSNINARRVINAQGLHVLPGIIDSQVHFREPGLEHKEDLGTGGKSAVLGGVTTFLEMPNTNPATTTKAALAEKVARARVKSPANFGFFLGATANNLEELKECHTWEGCCGIKVFLGSSTGDLLLYDQDKLRAIFSQVKAPIAIHSENEERLRERKHIQQNAKSVLEHPVWRDEETAFSATQKIIQLARETGKKIHVLHITTKQEIEWLARQKDICTVEVTPQHLTLYAPDCYERIGTLAQMNPPIRGKEHRDALWVGLKKGVVDVLGSDHAPHTLEEKNKGYPNTPSGMPGVQTMLPVMLDHVNNGKLTLEELVQLLCERPAKLYGLATKGELKLGFDADITLVDMNKKHTFTHEEMATRSGWTPYVGMQVRGMPVTTIVAGEVVVESGKLVSTRCGQPIQSQLHR